MKNLFAVVLLFALAGVASGQSKARFTEKVRAAPTPPPPIFQRSQVDGAVPRAVKGGNPLQMVNPLAPAKYGTAAQSVILEPYTTKWNGIKLFEIFW